MQYARVITPTREALIALEPTNWGAPYQKLFDQTDVSGYEEWLAYSHNNFHNPSEKADEQRYQQRGWWAEIVCDKVKVGRRGIDYISHAGTEWEKTHSGIWAPLNGWCVPTDDGMFYEGTLIPFETVEDRQKAIRRLEAKGIPAARASYFWRPEVYDSERFVVRGFDPAWVGYGRFNVDANWRPSLSGCDRLASRPAYVRSDIVMEVAEQQAVAR